MSNPLLSLFEDPKHLELVRTVIEKTRQGKLRWNKSTTTYQTNLPNGTELTFALSSSFFNVLKGSKTWATFSVRLRDGNEILQVQQSGFLPIPGVQDAQKSRIESAVEELFALVDNSARSEVDNVIEQLKNL